MSTEKETLSEELIPQTDETFSPPTEDTDALTTTAPDDAAAEAIDEDDDDGSGGVMDEEDDDDELHTVGQVDDDEDVVFSLPFKIEAEELYQFQIDMGKEQIEKNRKRSKYVSIAEIVLGVFYFGSIIAGKIANGMMQYLLALALVGLGVYGFLYYRYWFYPSLHKSVLKQHSKTPYFQSEIEIRFYETKCVECACGKETPNYWRNLHAVMESTGAYYLQLDKNRCLLIPKRSAGPELEPFLREICERFEKSWKIVG